MKIYCVFYLSFLSFIFLVYKIPSAEEIKSNKLVRQLLIYAFLWTCLATSLYFFSLEIINKYSTDVVEQRKIFSLADSVVTPISFIAQLFLTRFFLENRFFGIKFVLIAYGVLFSIAFFAISGAI